eukprot:gene7234-342_t
MADDLEERWFAVERQLAGSAADQTNGEKRQGEGDGRRREETTKERVLMDPVHFEDPWKLPFPRQSGTTNTAPHPSPSAPSAHSSTHTTSKCTASPPSTSSPSPLAASEAKDGVLLHYGKILASLGLLEVLDLCAKGVLVPQGITFPSSLVLMFAIPLALMAVGDKVASPFRSFFTPSLDWIAKWLPLFYVASLVTLPLALTTLSVFIRNLVKTENTEVTKLPAASPRATPAKKSTPFVPAHFVAWGSVAAVSLAATILGAPEALRPILAMPLWPGNHCRGLPDGKPGSRQLAWGYLMGNLVPGNLHGILHPVVVTALVANGCTAFYASVIGQTYHGALQAYLAKGTGPMGAGDLLMSFLGIVIISMGFRIYDQRETLKRHAPEILGATLLSALFSFFTTAYAAKALGLSASPSRALIPRSVTVALALPIAASFDAPTSITAAAVLLQHPALGLSVSFSRALIPRSVTVALALPIAASFDAPTSITAAAVLLQCCCRSVTVALALPIAASSDAPTSITAAAVLLQGLLGAKFGPGLLSAGLLGANFGPGLLSAGLLGANFSPGLLSAGLMRANFGPGLLSAGLLGANFSPGLPRAGLLGANFGPGLLSAVGIKDTIARGLAAAGTAGGLGTASLTSKEPEALPFCALSYSLVGIISTILATSPAVRNALFAIVG